MEKKNNKNKVTDSGELLEDKDEILSISDDNDKLLVYIGNNFETLNLESKIKVVLHLKQFINNQKKNIIKIIEEI